jgi:hypothetical protein
VNSSGEMLFDIPGNCWDHDCRFGSCVDIFNQANEANEDNKRAAGRCFGQACS